MNGGWEEGHWKSKSDSARLGEAQEGLVAESPLLPGSKSSCRSLGVWFPGEEKQSSCRFLDSNYLHGNLSLPIRRVTSGGSGESCFPTEVATTDSLRGHGQPRETALIPKGPHLLEQTGQRERGNNRSIELKEIIFERGLCLSLFLLFLTLGLR